MTKAFKSSSSIGCIEVDDGDPSIVEQPIGSYSVAVVDQQELLIRLLTADGIPVPDDGPLTPAKVESLRARKLAQGKGLESRPPTSSEAVRPAAVPPAEDTDGARMLLRAEQTEGKVHAMGNPGELSVDERFDRSHLLANAEFFRLQARRSRKG